jgi:probable rRNA maturation factor
LVTVSKKITGVSQLALARFLTKARRVIGSGQVDVLITSNGEIQELNGRFRRKDKPTDVLSFPVSIESDNFAGDIAISAEIAAENARRLGHSLNEELKVLVLHGLLHLAGYDHETDQGEMACREARLRKQLNLPQSLIERAGSYADVPLRRQGKLAPSTKIDSTASSNSRKRRS